LGVGDSVTFCGFVADADLPAYYRLADLFVMPSRGEGFGIVFLEAMASGTPVLGGNQDGTVDALSDGALGALVDPQDPEGLADELHRLLQGVGPPAWFEPNTLRDACLSHHGRAAFASRITDALPKLQGVSH
jgi:glycosyltransferase involved in cell wall biosynthesis